LKVGEERGVVRHTMGALGPSLKNRLTRKGEWAIDPKRGLLFSLLYMRGGSAGTDGKQLTRTLLTQTGPVFESGDPRTCLVAERDESGDADYV